MTTKTDTTYPAPVSPIHLAASKDDMRPALQTVQVVAVDGVACYAATDSYVLGVVPIGDDVPAPDETLMVPADMMEAASKASAKGSASVVIDGDSVDAKLEPRGKRASTVHGELVQGTAPSVTQLLTAPPEDAYTVVVSVDRLLQLAKALGAGRDNVVVLSVGPNPLKPIHMHVGGSPDRRGLVMPARLRD